MERELQQESAHGDIFHLVQCSRCSLHEIGFNRLCPTDAKRYRIHRRPFAVDESVEFQDRRTISTCRWRKVISGSLAKAVVAERREFYRAGGLYINRGKVMQKHDMETTLNLVWSEIDAKPTIAFHKSGNHRKSREVLGILLRMKERGRHAPVPPSQFQSLLAGVNKLF